MVGQESEISCQEDNPRKDDDDYLVKHVWTQHK